MKIFFANLDEVPEHLREKAVKQDDGSYIYEGDGLVKKNAELLNENAKLKGLEKLLKGLDTSKLTPESIKDALTEHERAGEREQEIARRIGLAIEENTRKHKGEIETSKAQVAKMQSSLEKYLLDSQLTRAIADEKGDARFIAPVLRNRLKVVQNGDDFTVQVLNDRGEVDFDANGKPSTVLSLVQGAKKDPNFASVFQAAPATGSGAPPATGNTGAAGGSTGVLALNAQGVVEIPYDQAKNAATYREAMALVKNDPSKVTFGQRP